MANPIKILSVDGGGIRGIIAARILQEIETRLRRPLGQVFDLIAGTSTGGIIACGLVKPGVPLTAAQLLQLYVGRGAEIFHRSLWRTVTTAGGIADERYPAEPLEQVLKETLGDGKLSDVTGPKLLVTAYAIELPAMAKVSARTDSTRSPFFFKSWNVDDPSKPLPAAWDFLLRDVARATSAAPTYFPPAEIYSVAGERTALIDGGVVANNPAVCAFAEAMRLWPGRDYVVVSVGTGALERDIPYREAKDWGLVEWARPVLSVLMDGSCDTVTYELNRILGDRHFRFDISLGTRGDPTAAYDDMDNTSPENLALLQGRADMLLGDARTKDRIGQLLALIS
jgi:patatin-like phospholipase/acyl hydrolase